mmetsp:Transcript_10009/g.16483  ORF Transcript_10009/g.16483 Transcript_10009/m.16483 type:complete len:142 (+) Transcript_10009:125-550(+)
MLAALKFVFNQATERVLPHSTSSVILKIANPRTLEFNAGSVVGRAAATAAVAAAVAATPFPAHSLAGLTNRHLWFRACLEPEGTSWFSSSRSPFTRQPHVLSSTIAFWTTLKGAITSITSPLGKNAEREQPLALAGTLAHP